MRLPFVKQNDIKDCGVCCLLMIIKYYKGNIPKEKLKELTKTTREGTTAYDLLEAAKKLNFITTGVTGDISNLKQEDLPCIAHVLIEEKYKHYIVIYKMNNKNLLIADPANGLKTISKETFSKISTNIYLLLTPRKKIPVIEFSKELKELIYKFIKFNKYRIIGLIFVSFGILLFETVNSLQLKLLLEYVIEMQSRLNLLNCFLLFTGISLLKNLFLSVQNSFCRYLNSEFGRNLFFRIYQHLLSLPYLYYRNHTTGEVMNKILNIKKIETVFSNTLLLVLIELPLMILFLIIFGFFEPKLFYLLLIFLIFEFILLFIVSKLGKRKLNTAKESTERLNSYITESILGVETIKSLNEHSSFIDSFKKKYLVKQQDEFNFLNNWNNQEFIKKITFELLRLVILCYSVNEVLKGRMLIGDMLFYQVLCSYLLEPIEQIFAFQLDFEEARHAWCEIENFLSIPEEKLISTKKSNLVFECLALKRISFRYQANNWIINNLSLQIRKGDRILFHGKSGGGKSTIARLLSRIIDPEKGNILINSSDIRNYPLSLIRNKIIYIHQESYLFTQSVFDNISLQKYSLDEVLEMGRSCLVDEIVADKPESYHYLLEENGYNLSGGERQRIILARSLLKEAWLYIFDESFSELDPNRERTILQTIFSKYPERTFIVISHHERNYDLFTRRIQLKNKRIEEYNDGN